MPNAQALRGVAANVVWEDDLVILRAACPLTAGTILSCASDLMHSDLETLLLTHGPEALLVAEEAQPSKQGALAGSVGLWLIVQDVKPS
jgi:hypothetical protein